MNLSRRMFAVFTISIILLIFPSCSSSNGPSGDDVLAFITRDQLTIHNNSERSIYHFVVGEQIATLIDWAPYLGDDNQISPGKGIDLSLNQKNLISPDDSVVLVYWWEAVEVNGERQPGNIEFLRIPIESHPFVN